jgi:hypothetical protein
MTNTHLTDVTVHIDENIDHDARAKIQEKLRGLAGVDSVVSHDDRPHLMMVQYDPQQLSSQAILACVKEQGVHAEMIGL